MNKKVIALSVVCTMIFSGCLEKKPLIDSETGGAVALEYSIALSCHNSIMTAYSYYHISTCIARVGKGLAPETERPAVIRAA